MITKNRRDKRYALNEHSGLPLAVQHLNNAGTHLGFSDRKIWPAVLKFAVSALLYPALGDGGGRGVSRRNRPRRVVLSGFLSGSPGFLLLPPWSWANRRQFIFNRPGHAAATTTVPRYQEG